MNNNLFSSDVINNIVDSIPAQVYLKDNNLRYVFVNQRFAQYKGLFREQIIGKGDYDIYPEQQAQNIVNEDSQVISTGFEMMYEHYSKKSDRYFAIRKTAVKDKNGTVVGLLAVIMDITEEKKVSVQLEAACRELEESREKFRDILENANDFIISMDEDGKIIYANQAFLNAVRLQESRLEKMSFFDFLTSSSREQIFVIFESIKKGIRISHSELVLEIPEGGRIVVEGNCTFRKFEGKKPYILGIFRDITQRKMDEEQIRFLAYHDVLTGLPNRLLFFDRISVEIDRSIRNGTLMAVMLMDLDKFKSINDTLGHSVGDALLKEVSERLKNTIRRIDTAARLGGDEFVIVLSGLKNNGDCKDIANRIIETLSQTYKLEGNTVEISVSLGISLFPEDGNDPDTLIRKADIAMYKAKATGGRSFRFYKA